MFHASEPRQRALLGDGGTAIAAGIGVQDAVRPIILCPMLWPRGETAGCDLGLWI